LISKYEIEKARFLPGLFLCCIFSLKMQLTVTAYSKALSFGALYVAFISSDSGMFRFSPLGGIGAMNHLA
jgi:hypothetical protein